MTENHVLVADCQQQLISEIQKLKSVAVAFSGGVDSAVVAQAAYLALGDQACAVMSVSPSLASGEFEIAEKTVTKIGINFRIIQTQEYLKPEYQQNSSKRCYYCKSELYASIGLLRDELRFETILNGANADDVGDHRPGMKAADEYEVLSPLLTLGINKNMVRQMAQGWRLPVWNKPATPCLASRIAYGVEVTIPGLKRVDLAEQFLKQILSLNELRVRDLGADQARIELPSPASSTTLIDTHHEKIVSYFKELGFKTVTLNMEPFQTGILNLQRELPVRILLERVNT